MNSNERRRSRIRPDIHIPPLWDKKTVLELAELAAGIEFAAMEIRRAPNAYYRPTGSVDWIWIEYIGERSALLTMPGLLPTFFEAGKSGYRRKADDEGRSIFVRRYSRDRWKLRVDARNFESAEDIAACIAKYWPEPVEVPFLDALTESCGEAQARLVKAIPNNECRPPMVRRAHLRLVVDNSNTGRRA